MYASFFGLHDEPFSVAPDPRFMYLSDAHRDALRHLETGLSGGGGFVLLTGEIGAGKTTAWRAFLERLPPDVDIATVVNPRLKVDALLARVCEDLGVPRPDAASGAVFDPIDALHGHLLLSHAQGRRTLIAVDEAQALSDEVLEQLRLLTNLVTSDRKLVQVLLIGQPELLETLARPEMEPLAQRIVARYHLPALPADETRRYIAHRLAVAGAGGPLPFDDEALDLVHRLCRGVPRRINVLCDRTMLAAFEARRARIDAALVARVATQVFIPPRKAAEPPLPAATDLPAPAPAPPPATQDAAAGAPAAAGRGRAWWPWVLAAGVAGVVASPWLRALWAGPPAMTAAALPAAGSARPPAAPAPGTAAAPAPAPAPAPAMAPATPAAALPLAATLAPLYAQAWDEATAWRALGAAWGLAGTGGEPCAQAAAQGLQCYRGKGGLAVIRALDRPVLLPLADEAGRSAHAVLWAVHDGVAELQAAEGRLRVPLVLLARHWRGDFATLWRAPAGYRDGQLVTAADPALSEALLRRLAAVDGGAGGDLAARVAAFQLAQGLPADGLVGALTLMQLNRASGVDEPRLAASGGASAR